MACFCSMGCLWAVKARNARREIAVAADKPEGKSSNDVVNACRRIFGERRVGHTGTLDPLATGALVVCVGPATRLDAYMVGHDKTYDVRISFGAATDTDDKLGEVIRTLDVPAQVCDPEFAQVILSGFVGKQKQMPPAYSAIKKGGVKACDAARKGNVIALEPRDIEVYSAELLDLERDPRADSIWSDVRFSVSKGTYIRALARDVGAACETCAHVETLRRTRAGVLDVEDCLSLDALERYGIEAAIDPVFLLESRMAFLDDGAYADVCNGKPLHASELSVYEAPHRFDADDCGPRRCAVPATSPLHDGELVCLVYGNDLKALYAFDAKTGKVSPHVFSRSYAWQKSIRSTKHSTTHCLLALRARSACSTVCIGAIGSLSTRRSAPLQKAAASRSPSLSTSTPMSVFMLIA